MPPNAEPTPHRGAGTSTQIPDQDHRHGTARQQWRDAIRDTDDPAIDVYTIAVAVAGLDRFMSADGLTYTGVRRLARLARTSKDTVSDRIGRLVELGWLERTSGGRGHKTTYKVSYPAGHLVSDTVGHPQVSGDAEVSDPSGQVSDPTGQSVLPGRTDPSSTPTTPKGGGGEGEAANAAPGESPRLEGGSTPGEGMMAWTINVAVELGFDPDEIDVHDPKLIDAATPLSGRRPVEIRDAVGRAPKVLRDNLKYPARWLASKLTELHSLEADDPRWQPRPKTAPKKQPSPAAPSTNGSKPTGLEDIQELCDNTWDVLDDLENAPGVYTTSPWETFLRDLNFMEWDDDGLIRRRPPDYQIQAVEEFCTKAKAWLHGEAPPPRIIRDNLDRRYEATDKGKQEWTGLCAMCLRTLPVNRQSIVHCQAAEAAGDLICDPCATSHFAKPCPHCAPLAQELL